jgi:hypothetical protein
MSKSKNEDISFGAILYNVPFSKVIQGNLKNKDFAKSSMKSIVCVGVKSYPTNN